MYHYVDPQGREQGPFAYAHLAKWFKAGYLRPNLGCRRQDETTYARTVTQALLEDGAMHGVPEHMLGEVVRPTTAARMDPYVNELQAAGGSLVMLAKGNRSRQVTEACHRHGGFYLGSIGGPAARLAKDCIKKVEVLEYAELGMEAVWRIEVEDFPAFIVVDDKGNDFFAGFTGGGKLKVVS